MSSLATGREKRANAGNKMGQLLESAEDEFFKTAYGGFEEVSFETCVFERFRF